jgi:GTP-binding protein Era
VPPTGAAITRSGLVALAGRANVGKSTLLNALVGEKVTIVSDKPQTTRWPVRAVLSSDGAQAVFIDTPGLHKPRGLLAERLNSRAEAAVVGIDVLVQVMDARAGVGRGDRIAMERLGRRDICVLNKVDGLPAAAVLSQLKELSEWGFGEYFAVSARTGRGVSELRDAIFARLPEGGPLYPPGAPARELPQQHWVAELVREQLLHLAREELPYSIHCRVTDWEPPYARCEVLVERESQKAMIIGKGGWLLKRAGSAARAQLPPGTYLELVVKVARDWQRKPEVLERLGL